MEATSWDYNTNAWGNVTALAFPLLNFNQIRIKCSPRPLLQGSVVGMSVNTCNVVCFACEFKVQTNVLVKTERMP